MHPLQKLTKKVIDDFFDTEMNLTYRLYTKNNF